MSCKPCDYKATTKSSLRKHEESEYAGNKCLLNYVIIKQPSTRGSVRTYVKLDVKSEKT